jgi:ankyrin repeat protein
VFEADPNLQDQDGQTALMRATSQGQTETVKELINFGADLNLQDQRGDTAVIIATQIPRPDVLQVLVSAGADLNLQNDEGLTALMISARGWGTELTDILLKGAEIHMNYDFRESRRGWSALFFSVESGNIAATQSLLKEDANTQLRDKNGSTVLDVATALAGKYADRSHACHGLHHRLASICSVLRSTTTECPNLQTLRNLVRRSRRKVEKVLKPSEKKLYGVHMRSNDKAAYQRRREIMSW